MALGFLISTIALMSVVGVASSNGWVRVGVAMIVTLVVPALIADRLRPKEDFLGAVGFTSDVFALWFAAFSVAFLALGPRTYPLLLREADREARGGAAVLAKVTYFLAAASPSVSGGDGESEAVDKNAPPGDAGG